MTGLVAIVAAEPGSRLDEGEVEQLADAYESLRGANGRQEVRAEGRAHACLLGVEDAGLRITRGAGSWAAAAGRVYGTLPPEGSLEELDGQFALVLRDENRGETLVATDPFGLRSLYVARRDGKLYVSTSCLALAKHLRAAPDPFGLQIFLRAGYHFGARTSWEGIERLLPGTCMTIASERVSEHRYWRAAVDPDVARLTFSETVANCLETAATTYGRYLGGPPDAWVDLTGGYDTRLLALQLRDAGVGFLTNTRGDPDDADREIANELARAANWKLLDLTSRPAWDKQLPELLPVALAWGDGNLEVLELSWVLWAHAELGRRQRSLLIAGGGEHYRGFAWRQEFLAAGKSNRVKMDNWLDMRLLHPMNTQLFASDPTADVRHDFETRMKAWAEPYSDEPNTTQLDVMYAYKMMGHFGAYASADGGFLVSELPFYFKPIFDAAFSSPHGHRDHHKLMRHMIWRLDPELAAISTTTGGPAMPWRAGNLHRVAPYYAQIGRKALNKISQRAVGRPILPAGAQDFYCEAPARQAAIRSVLGSDAPETDDMRSAPLFDRGELSGLLERAQEPGFGETGVLGRVLTVELALRALDTDLE
jgi:asparagine synthase (glutamine-hydrolysing)